LAKALGNGLPIGACVARGEFAGTFGPGDHGTTFGGGSVVCAAALVVIDVIEKEGLVEKAASLGTYLHNAFEKMIDTHPLVTGVRGKGLLIALQLSEDRAREIVSKALEAGLVINDVTPSALRVAPPLIVSEEECARTIAMLDEILSDVEKISS
jgi:acetylornithine aminotransferase